MTTPNQQGQPDPPGSMPTYGSWSEVQHKSEQDWKDDINSQWDTKFNPIQDGTNFLIVLMLKLLASLLNMVPIIGNTLAGVVTNIANGLNTTHNTAVTANNNANQALTEIGNIQSAAVATPAWVSNLTDMASVPRALLIPQPGTTTGSYTVSGTTGGGGSHSCSDASHSHTNHTHSFSDGSHTHSMSKSMPAYKPFANNVAGNSYGTVYYTPIVCDRTGTLDKLRFITGPDSIAFSIDEYWLAVCAYNPLNGNIEKVWQSSNLKNSIGDDRAEIEVALGLSQTVEPAKVLFIAHLQRQPAIGGSTRNVAAVPQPGVSRPTSVLLRAPCYSQSNQTSIPNSVSLSSLSFELDFLPWYALSVTN